MIQADPELASLGVRTSAPHPDPPTHPSPRPRAPRAPRLSPLTGSRLEVLVAASQSFRVCSGTSGAPLCWTPDLRKYTPLRPVIILPPGQKTCCGASCASWPPCTERPPRTDLARPSTASPAAGARGPGPAGDRKDPDKRAQPTGNLICPLRIGWEQRWNIMGRRAGRGGALGFGCTINPPARRKGERKGVGVRLAAKRAFSLRSVCCGRDQIRWTPDFVHEMPCQRPQYRYTAG